MSVTANLQACLWKRCIRFGAVNRPSRYLSTTSTPSPNSTTFPTSTNSSISTAAPIPKTPTRRNPNPFGLKERFPTKELSYHWDTIPPTNDQLAKAVTFFATKPANFLWSSEKFVDMEFGENDSPEVCFLGRSNVGKSSLLNALFLKNLAYTSNRPGRTKLMNAFAIGDPTDKKNRLVVLDMPGYGKGGRAEWGKEIVKYLEKRRQLKRVFLLINSKHGVKPSDQQIIALFKQLKVPFQIVLSKADEIVFPGKKSRSFNLEAVKNRISELRRIMETVKDTVQFDADADGLVVGEVIACSSQKWVEGHRMGINELRFAMLRAAGLEYRPPLKPKKPMDLVSHEELIGKIPYFP